MSLLVTYRMMDDGSVRQEAEEVLDGKSWSVVHRQIVSEDGIIVTPVDES